MALSLTTKDSFAPLHTAGFYPLDVLLCTHWADSGLKCSQRAKVRHLSGKILPGASLDFFFPSLRFGRTEPLAYTVKNYSVFANTNMHSEFPLSQHIHQPPTTWQLPSTARQLLSQRSEDFLTYSSLPIKGSCGIGPADHVP